MEFMFDPVRFGADGDLSASALEDLRLGAGRWHHLLRTPGRAAARWRLALGAQSANEPSTQSGNQTTHQTHSLNTHI